MKNQSLSFPRISLTRSLPKPNQYAVSLLKENLDLNYDEERALAFKGRWRKACFEADEKSPLDLEIGTGNGFHFADYVIKNPNRNIVGIEIKYKPLIQSLKRAKKSEQHNFRLVRYTAKYLEDLFAKEELNNIFIHFPDPWAYKRHQLKNRLLDRNYFYKLHDLQRPGGLIEFKTDHREYFLSVKEAIKGTPYEILRYTEDLHHSLWQKTNFMTHFEKLWASKGLNAHMMLLKKK